MSELGSIRESIIQLCNKFPNKYWRELEKTKGYPDEFVKVLSAEGFLSVLIPENFGGAGLGLEAAGIILEEISRSGGHPGAFHAQMYTMGTILNHGSEQQKQKYLPAIAEGKLRLQAFGVTEPAAGTDTTSISTFAERKGEKYIINGQKVWISRVEYSDLLLLLARTTPKDQIKHKTDGLSVFLVDIREAVDSGLTIRPVETMVNHHTTELFFDNLEIPKEALIGNEGEGFKYILDGMNAERILIAYECIGDAKFFIEQSSSYATERKVFGRAIGKNQGIQFPIARCYVQMRSAELMTQLAAKKFDAGEPCGEEANMAKLLASETSWEAGDTCLQTYGGLGMAKEYDIERKFRETRLYRIAPISTNLILSYIGEHVLGMPRSF